MAQAQYVALVQYNTIDGTCIEAFDSVETAREYMLLLNNNNIRYGYVADSAYIINTPVRGAHWVSIHTL